MTAEGRTYSCSICQDPSTGICVFCTKDACPNHLCPRCGRCSDCCACEVPLDEPAAQTKTAEPAVQTKPTEAAAETKTAEPEVPAS